MTKKYDIALSFAGEDRTYVSEVADLLTQRGVSVFYDMYEEASLWGEDLYVHLTDIYRDKAKYTLMFVSKSYSDKLWTNLERRAAQARAFTDYQGYILPARFDDSDVLGLLSTTGYIDLRVKSPAEVVILVCQKLGMNPFEIKAHMVSPPKKEDICAEVKFDYSNNNGLFRIGSGALEFSTKWSKSSSSSIHCYNDSTNIRGVALAPEGASLKSLTSVASLDYTSRSRTPKIGSFVVLQNIHGIYAAIKIINIKDNTRGDVTDELEFKYWIQKLGSDDFSCFED